MSLLLLGRVKLGLVPLCPVHCPLLGALAQWQQVERVTLLWRGPGTFMVSFLESGLSGLCPWSRRERKRPSCAGQSRSRSSQGSEEVVRATALEATRGSWRKVPHSSHSLSTCHESGATLRWLSSEGDRHRKEISTPLSLMVKGAVCGECMSLWRLL